MNQPKTHSANQLCPDSLGITDRFFGLLQRSEVRSKRHNTPQHQGDRSEGCDLTGPEKAKDDDEQQRETAGDRNLGRQNEFPASLGNLGKRLDPIFDVGDFVGIIVVSHRT